MRSFANICDLNLVDVLGNQANEDECLKFLPVNDSTNFSLLPATWSILKQGESLSPGRKVAGIEWIYYDTRANGGEGAL